MTKFLSSTNQNSVPVDPDSLSSHIISRSMPFRIGSFLLQLKRFHTRFRISDSLMEHEHPFFELVFTDRGYIRYTVDGRTVNPDYDRRRIFLAPPGLAHRRIVLTSDSCLTLLQFSLVPENEEGTVSLERLKREIMEKSCSLPMTSYLKSLADSWYEMTEQRPPLWTERTENRLKEFLLAIFAENFAGLFSRNSLKKRLYIHGVRQEQIVQAIEAALDTNLDMAGYSSLIGLSGRHISRLLKQSTGMSMNRYVRSRRIRLAREMLETQNMSVKDVAAALGFQDVSYFCKVFRESIGITPGKLASFSKKRDP
ncbi:MAG: HTH-type transcriptional activator Btr [Lentisphaerae bacterium ADurb.Bin242]|nr:MAG: HTH-type transcriptional activator Btr [Lentisphaerae bacterium ADurb.Bin242]